MTRPHVEGAASPVKLKYYAPQIQELTILIHIEPWNYTANQIGETNIFVLRE